MYRLIAAIAATAGEDGAVAATLAEHRRWLSDWKHCRIAFVAGAAAAFDGASVAVADADAGALFGRDVACQTKCLLRPMILPPYRADG